jgi:hypothetical protein
MVDRVGVVQPTTEGFGFNICADGLPLRLMVVEFKSREDAENARDRVFEALNRAIRVSTAR